MGAILISIIFTKDFTPKKKKNNDRKGIIEKNYLEALMAITYKKEDDLEKILEKFASFDKLEEIEFPDPKSNQTTDKEDVK